MQQQSVFAVNLEATETLKKRTSCIAWINVLTRFAVKTTPANNT